VVKDLEYFNIKMAIKWRMNLLFIARLLSITVHWNPDFFFQRIIPYQKPP